MQQDPPPSLAARIGSPLHLGTAPRPLPARSILPANPAAAGLPQRPPVDWGRGNDAPLPSRYDDKEEGEEIDDPVRMHRVVSGPGSVGDRSRRRSPGPRRRDDSRDRGDRNPPPRRGGRDRSFERYEGARYGGGGGGRGPPPRRRSRSKSRSRSRSRSPVKNRGGSGSGGYRDARGYRLNGRDQYRPRSRDRYPSRSPPRTSPLVVPKPIPV